jgi:hypothetical protein
MQNRPAESWAVRGSGSGQGVSGVAVLAGRDDDRPGALRPGPMIFPLDRRVAPRSAVVGLEVATTARLVELLSLPPTVAVAVPSDVDLEGVVDQVRDVACALLGVAGEVLTVGVACPGPVPPGTAGELCLYNVPVDALPEALVESAAAAHRANLVTLHGNLVLLVQRFAPPSASAVVHVSADRRQPVRISGRWGLTEDGQPADQFEVAEDGTVRERLASKPTAQVTATGGTRTVNLSASCADERSLPEEAVLELAACARAAAHATGSPLALDVAMYDGTPLVLRCRPCDPSAL